MKYVQSYDRLTRGYMPRWRLVAPLILLAILAAALATSSPDRAGALPEPDLTVAVSGPASVAPGASFAYSVTVTNGGGVPADNVVLQFTVPAGATYVSSTTSAAFPTVDTYTNSGVTTLIFHTAPGNTTSIPNAGTGAVTVTVTAPTTPGTIDVPAGAAVVNPFGGIVESNYANNSSPGTSTTVETPPPPSVVNLTFATPNGVTASPASVNPGGAITYSIYAINTGTSDASNVVVQFPLPTGVTYSSSSGADSTTQLDGSVYLTINTLQAGVANAVTLTVTVNVLSSATGTITVPANSIVIDPYNTITETNEADNATPSADVDTSVVLLPDLTVSITGPATATAGAPEGIVYDIEVANSGTGTATIPSGATVATFEVPAGLASSYSSATVPAGYAASINASTITVVTTAAEVLGPGANVNLLLKFDVPSTPTNTTYTVLSNAVEVNPGCYSSGTGTGIQESNCSNNTAPEAPATVVTTTGSGSCIGGQTCYVGGAGASDANLGTQSSPFATISKAISAIGTGGTINVASGTYTPSGALSVTKAVTIKGARAGVSGTSRSASPLSSSESIIHVATGSHGFDVTASDVTIDGFAITNADPAVWIDPSASSVTIENSILTGNQIGVYPNCADDCLIQHNLFQANNLPGSSGGASIYADGGSSGVTIDSNKFTGNTLNSAIIFGATPTTYNTQLLIENNLIENNNDSNSMIYLVKTTNSTITGNRIDGGSHSITLANDIGTDSGIQIAGNTLISVTADGHASVNLLGATGTTVSDNIFSYNALDVGGSGADNTTISGNTSSWPETSIDTSGLGTVAISDNVIKGPSVAGIFVNPDSGATTTISSNTVTSTGTYDTAAGLELTGDLSGVSATGNIIIGNTYGLKIDAGATVSWDKIQHNYIVSNLHNVQNENSAGITFDATCNYWATTNAASIVTGSGTSTVTVTPWIISSSRSSASVLAAPCYTGAPTISVSDGTTTWTPGVTNDLSVGARAHWVRITVTCADPGGPGLIYSASCASKTVLVSAANIGQSTTFTVTATDKAGNVTSATYTYEIVP